MEKYDYFKAVAEDVRNYISEAEVMDCGPWERSQLEEHLNEVLWLEDSVTGNASGSYYCYTQDAEEALCHNWDLLAEAARELGCEADILFERGAEYADTLCRCYMLDAAITIVLDELEKAGAFRPEEAALHVA